MSDEGTGQKPKPKDFEEAFKSMVMTPEEEAELEDDKFEQVAGTPKRLSKQEEEPAAEAQTDPAPRDPNAIPEWVELPPDLKIPPGKELAFMRFRAHWTDRPELGERQVILWGLTDADEKLAYMRTRGQAARTLSELSKQTIRAIDGKRASWTGQPKDGPQVEKFWDQIGPKCRQMIQNYFVKTNALSTEEQADFFLDCFTVRRSVAG